MRKLIILLFLALPLTLLAQSSMTDSQVANYIQQEVKRGTSQSQIVTHLMQSGVDISQIRRVRNAYERMQNGSGFGTAKSSQGKSRLRQGNGGTKGSYSEQQAYRRATQSEDRYRNNMTSQRIAGNTRGSSNIMKMMPTSRIMLQTLRP